MNQLRTAGTVEAATIRPSPRAARAVRPALPPTSAHGTLVLPRMTTEGVGPGTLLGGDFRLVQPLSSGGMGALFVAEQLSTGKRRAVKVMHSGLLDSPALRERFAREARIGSLVQSDHVVEV